MDKDAAFAQMLPTIEGAPCSEVQALGHLMQNWLKTEMSDNGSPVDAGGGFSSYDLWVNFGGKELYINIREANKRPT